jgi:hypothetical protein
MFALWKQFLRHNHQIQAEFKKPVHYGQAFFCTFCISRKIISLRTPLTPEGELYST